ncbi:MAG: S-layer homology domain-containing protein [Clostridia bacterium]|nr:S-layer homology domain-containing protein [Clostridia bacterium]
MKRVLFLTACLVAVLSLFTVCFAVRQISSTELEKLLERAGATELSDDTVTLITMLSGETLGISRATEATDSSTTTTSTVVRPSRPSRPSTSRVTSSGESTGVVTRPSTSTTTSTDATEEGESTSKVVMDPDRLAEIMAAIASGDVSVSLPIVRPTIKLSGDLTTLDTEAIATIIETLVAEKGKVSGEDAVQTRPTAPAKVEKVSWAEASAWALDELNAANEKGLIPQVFSKANLKANITRKEFAHVSVKLYELLSGKAAEKPAKNPFTDTDDEEVLKAYNVGITEGTDKEKGLFSPDKEITREQMATMITRALEKAGIDVTVDLTKVKEFTDDSEMHNWSRSAIYFMADKEIINGVDTKAYRYGVKSNASREQALVISGRSAEKFAK